MTLGLQGATLASGVACAAVGWRDGFPLMIGVVPLGLVTGALQVRFMLARDPDRSAVQVQHLRALVGAGVSVYTAFFSFGAANLLPQIAFNPLLWAAPTLVGCAIIAYHQMRLAPAARRHETSALGARHRS